MRKTMLKRVFATFVAVSMVFALGACGKDKDNAASNPKDGGTSGGSSTTSPQAANPSDAMTESEYEQMVEQVFTEVGQIQTLDVSNADSIKEAVDSMQQQLDILADATAPEMYAKAHEKIKSGAEGLSAVLTSLEAIASETDEAKAKADLDALQPSVTGAVSDIAEGLQEMNAVRNAA